MGQAVTLLLRGGCRVPDVPCPPCPCGSVPPARTGQAREGDPNLRPSCRFCPQHHPSPSRLSALKESLSVALQKALNHVHPGRNPLAFHLLLSVAFFFLFIWSALVF